MAGLVSDDLNKFGPFGKYNGSTQVTNTVVDFTGSNLGAAAFIPSGTMSNGVIYLARGGAIPMNTLTVGSLYEIGVARVSSSTAIESVYVLKR